MDNDIKLAIHKCAELRTLDDPAATCLREVSHVKSRSIETSVTASTRR